MKKNGKKTRPKRISTQSRSYDPYDSNSSYVSSQDSSDNESKSLKEWPPSLREEWPTRDLPEEESQDVRPLTPLSTPEAPVPKLKIQKQGTSFHCSSLLDCDSTLVKSEFGTNFASQNQNAVNNNVNTRSDLKTCCKPSFSNLASSVNNSLQENVNRLQAKLLVTRSKKVERLLTETEAKLSKVKREPAFAMFNTSQPNVGNGTSNSFTFPATNHNCLLPTLTPAIFDSKMGHEYSQIHNNSVLLSKDNRVPPVLNNEQRLPYNVTNWTFKPELNNELLSATNIQCLTKHSQVNRSQGGIPKMGDTVSKLARRLQCPNFDSLGNLQKPAQHYHNNYYDPSHERLAPKLEPKLEPLCESDWSYRTEPNLMPQLEQHHPTDHYLNSVKSETCLYDDYTLGRTGAEVSDNEHMQYHHKQNQLWHNYQLPETTSLMTTPTLTPHLKKEKSSSRHKKRHKHSGKHSKASAPRSTKHTKGLAHSDQASEKWAKTLGDLWQCQSPNFEAEREFNLRSSAVEPHCSICLLFKPSQVLKRLSENEGKEMTQSLPSRSKVLVPAALFSPTNVQDESFFSNSPPHLIPHEAALDNNPLLDNIDGSSPLLCCLRCNVCVHATCYGILREDPNWLCDRCSKIGNFKDCCLCSVRGGALKPTTSGQWAHVICTIVIPEAFFMNVVTKDCVDLSMITRQRQKLRCNFCWSLNGSIQLRHSGICIQCTSGKCPTAFHATCGHISGVLFEPGAGIYPIKIACTKHLRNRDRDRTIRDLRSLEVGEKVIGKQHHLRRYYHCQVLEINVHTRYSVEFDTSSYCDHILEQDILTPLSSLEIGENVEIKWLDGLVYTCLYKGQQQVCNVTVEFEDGSRETVKREDLYTLEESLPRKVQSKLSFATEPDKRGLFLDTD